MNRVFKIANKYGFGDTKYVLLKEVGNVGIYQEKTGYGYFVHQSWLLKRDDEERVFLFESFNDIIWEELLDYADLLNEKKRFGLRAMLKDSIYSIHPNGKVAI